MLTMMWKCYQKNTSLVYSTHDEYDIMYCFLLIVDPTSDHADKMTDVEMPRGPEISEGMTAEVMVGTTGTAIRPGQKSRYVQFIILFLL